MRHSHMANKLVSSHQQQFNYDNYDENEKGKKHEKSKNLSNIIIALLCVF